MTALGNFVRPALRRWLWSHRATLFALPLLFGAGSQFLESAELERQKQPTATVQPPWLYTVTSIPSPAPRVSSILAKTTEAPASVTLRTDSVNPPLLKRSQDLPIVPIRVGLVRGGSQVVIQTSTAVIVCVDHNPTTDRCADQRLTTLPANSALTLRPSSRRLIAQSFNLPPVIWLKPKGKGAISINGRWYRGQLQVILHKRRIIAVNHLDLESYLYGVVGSEMPALWPLEALKAQAVAARSYALSRIAYPFSSFYDLGDTPRWQAYQGLMTETDAVHTAVDHTQGLVVSYQGSIVEALYAATERLVRTVHGGYGMSQRGALKLAQKKFTYRQILDAFYPGTKLIELADAF